MSSYYQKINTLYKRDMTKPKKPIILGGIFGAWVWSS